MELLLLTTLYLEQLNFWARGTGQLAHVTV